MRNLYALAALAGLGAALLGSSLFLALSGKSAVVKFYLDASQTAILLRRSSPEDTIIQTVQWVSRRYTDSPNYHAEMHTFLDWPYGAFGSCDQVASLTQLLLHQNDIHSEIVALRGEEAVSRHTVLRVKLAQSWIIVDPYFGWIPRDSNGRFASFRDIQAALFKVSRLDPADRLDLYSPEEYQRLFAPHQAPQVLGWPLEDVYSWKGRLLLDWSRRMALLLTPFSLQPGLGPVPASPETPATGVDPP